MLPIVGWAMLILCAAVVAGLYYRGFRRRRMNRERDLATRVRTALESQLREEYPTGRQGVA